MRTTVISQIVITLVVIVILATNYSSFAERFKSAYPCLDATKKCLVSGEVTVDGFKVKRDCHEYAYTKTCNYPSKNNCREFAHCYYVQDNECLLKDSYGNCVNQKREFSCKTHELSKIFKDKLKMGFEEKEGQTKLICRGLPCLDGNCVDKSYFTDDDMMDSLSQLHALAKMKDGLDMGFKVFGGIELHCSKKPCSFSNCCSLSQKGWGKNFGAHCNKQEQDLIARQQKNLCVPVGKTKNKGIAGAPGVVKLHFCCFPNILTKIIQEQGRRQLGKTFGTGDAPDCTGLSLDDIQALDFDKMDFTDFYAEIKQKMQVPAEEDMREQAQNSLQYIYKGDPKNPYNPDNKYAGTIDFEKKEREAQEKIAKEEALRQQELQQQQREIRKTEITQQIADLKTKYQSLQTKERELLEQTKKLSNQIAVLNEQVSASWRRTQPFLDIKNPFLHSHERKPELDKRLTLGKDIDLLFTSQQNIEQQITQIQGEVTTIQGQIQTLEQQLEKGDY